MYFEWDENKNKSNIKKHGVSFEDARGVFYDSHARIFSDPDSLVKEDRFLLLGISISLKLLIVCHCYREKDEVIRIISARKATKKESTYYGRNI